MLVLFSIVLIFNKPIRNLIIGWNSNKYQISNIDKEKVQENAAAEVSYDFNAVSSIDTQTILANQMNGQELPVIGGIAIPELGINLPIFKGLGNTELSYGAGTMKEDQVMGGENNYSLASHHIFGISGSSDMLFSPLDKAQQGQVVYLTDKEIVYTYIITEVKEVEPEAVEVIDDVPGKSLLTLVTCNDVEATKRIIVVAELESSAEWDNIPEEAQKAFQKSYNQIS